MGQNWWKATRFDHDDLYIKPNEAMFIIEAQGSKRPVFLSRLKMSIQSEKWELTETQRKVTDSLVALPSYKEESTDQDAVIMTERGARARYVARDIPEQQWASKSTLWKFSHLPLHQNADYGTLTIVCTRVITRRELDPKNLPEGLRPLEDWEEELMQKKFPARR
ncbi:hypothetical protein ACFWP5_08935 [Streptomyces sp. NPDC058469]|uniref:hypothetical protein n=1 Tax=Streptomyces sp. NPDC058469 TaxID=3346514 RepID=UPI00364B564E